MPDGSVGRPLLALLAALLGALAVVMGAFGAHALRTHLGAADLATYETATRYLLPHAALAMALSMAAPPGRLLDAAIAALLGGAALFAISLYALVLGDWRWLGAVTPAGGLAMVAGWLLLGCAAWRLRDGGNGSHTSG